MSSKSNDQGRAFEYACILELADRIRKYRPVTIDEISVQASKRAWATQDSNNKETMLIAAASFIDTLFSAEPLILECTDNKDVETLSINKDSDAESGDVRDIVITRKFIQWEIGLSMKHNHFAAKHSRLSSTIDFGAKWYGIPCADSYWDVIKPIFNKLREYKKEKIAWHDIIDKEDSIYVPIISAFINELNRAYLTDNTLPSRLISYYLVPAISIKSLQLIKNN